MFGCTNLPDTQFISRAAAGRVPAGDRDTVGDTEHQEQAVAFRRTAQQRHGCLGRISFEISERKELEKLRGRRGVHFASLCSGGSLRVQGSGFALGAQDEIKR